jgi:hypothetical protein
VPHRISYDNSKVMVAKIIGTYARKLTDGFLKLQSHYLFTEHFCRVARANEKGVVEGVVKFARLNFLVPVPQVRDLTELNARLADQCREDLQRRLRGKNGTKAQLLIEDQAAFLPLPAGDFDACRKSPTQANSLSLVRFEDNDYSVPVAYAHHEIVAKGYVDRVLLCHQDKAVAAHERSWGREGVYYDFRHYLPLLERKPGALEHARPLMNLELPVCFDTLKRRLVAAEVKPGDGLREFIRVLRLLEDHPLARLKQAVEKALIARAHSRDAIAQFLTPWLPWPETSFWLEGCAHLRRVQVKGPDLSAYQSLLGGAP